MKIIAISDTHNKHNQLEIEECDVLVHAGDFSSMGIIKENTEFLKWFDSQPAKHKIFISGNHDFLDYDIPEIFNELLKQYPGITYLRDEGCEIDGVKFWGRPWVPKFYDWAFMKERGSSAMRQTLDVIPSDIDVLITHGPPKGILDLTSRGEQVGCQDLLDWLYASDTPPKLLICGHIHHSAGWFIDSKTKYINAAVLDDGYKRRDDPVVIDYGALK